MSTRVTELEAGHAMPAATLERATNPFLWSVRREVWENRSLYVVPLIMAMVGIAVFVLHAMLPPHPMPDWLEMVPGRPGNAKAAPFNAMSAILMATAFLVGVFYCLDALQGERRDRSILFWKSMPVSDLTTVLSKAAVPLLVLPAIVFVIAMVAQFALLLMSTVWVIVAGAAGDLGTLWRSFSLFERPLRLIYALVVSTLWHAPIYGWLLLVSGWAKRAAFVWAVLPIGIAFVVETLSFETRYIASLLPRRVFGWSQAAFDPLPGAPKEAPPTVLAPGDFLTSPDLWLGLALAAVFIAAAVRLRRGRGPI